MISDAFIIICNFYFIFNAKFTYDYCNAPLSNITTLGALALDFCEKHNPIVCARPEYFRVLCCIDGYFFIYCYIFTIYITLTHNWYKYRFFVTIYYGAFMYSEIYTWIMYSNFSPPPSGSIEFYATEIPYPIVFCIMLYKALTAKPLIIVAPKSKNY